MAGQWTVSTGYWRQNDDSLLLSSMVVVGLGNTCVPLIMFLPPAWVMEGRQIHVICKERQNSMRSVYCVHKELAWLLFSHSYLAKHRREETSQAPGVVSVRMLPGEFAADRRPGYYELLAQ